MRYFLIAGEPSGDQHAARLMQALARKDSKAEFGFLGGDLMSESGGNPVVHIREMAFMGFTQVLSHLGQIRHNFRRARKAIDEFNPDVIILVDYPGFNLRMAKWAKRKGYTCFYYISPTVWAWNTKRVYGIRENCAKVFCILPFEPDFYRKYNMEAEYVGNPVFEEVRRVKSALPENHPGKNKRIALLPGSRKQEIERILPEMLKVIPEFKEYDFVIAGMTAHIDIYKKLIPDNCRVNLKFNSSLEILNECDAALVTSGTATLETALMGIPQVICYKTNGLSYLIAKGLIKVPYISLVNLILEGPAVPELIQANCNAGHMVECMESILPGGPNHEDQLELVQRIQHKLGEHRVSENLSDQIISYLSPLEQHGKIF